MHRQLAPRIYSNQDISLRTNKTNISEGRFIIYLENRWMCLIDDSYAIEKERQQLCKIRPDLRWHISVAGLEQLVTVFGIRKDRRAHV